MMFGLGSPGVDLDNLLESVRLTVQRLDVALLFGLVIRKKAAKWFRRFDVGTVLLRRVNLASEFGFVDDSGSASLNPCAGDDTDRVNAVAESQIGDVVRQQENSPLALNHPAQVGLYADAPRLSYEN